MTFSDQADVMFNMTLLHQEYVNGTYEKSNCERFNPNKPCLRTFLWLVYLKRSYSCYEMIVMSWKNSLELIELSSMNKVSLV